MRDVSGNRFARALRKNGFAEADAEVGALKKCDTS